MIEVTTVSALKPGPVFRMGAFMGNMWGIRAGDILVPRSVTPDPNSPYLRVEKINPKTFRVAVELGNLREVQYVQHCNAWFHKRPNDPDIKRRIWAGDFKPRVADELVWVRFDGEDIQIKLHWAPGSAGTYVVGHIMQRINNSYYVPGDILVLNRDELDEFEISKPLPKPKPNKRKQQKLKTGVFSGLDSLF